MRREKLWSFVELTVGSLVAGIGLALFLIPNRIAAGGISGLATVLHYMLGFPVGLTMLALNVPLFVAGWKRLGIEFATKTAYGTAALSVFVDLLSVVPGPTHDPLLASIYGGMLIGAGLGVVFRAGGTTGGTDLAAQLARSLVRVSSGWALLFIDGAVIGMAALVFGVELALYALLSLFISSRVIDVVQEGVGYAKLAIIISPHHEAISRAILYELGRGVTGLAGRGLWTSEQREILLCVVNRSEVTRLKYLVAKIDPRAFLIVGNTHEVLGEGFKSLIEQR